MAELIPMEYRIRIARGQLISRWTTTVIVIAAIAAAGVIHTYLWKRKQTNEYTSLQQQYREDAVLIQRYSDLHARRADLAARMMKMEDLQTDKTLLAILNNVAGGFSDADCLEYVRIDAHPMDKKPQEARYSVRLRGITANDTTHSTFLERLTDIGRKAQPSLVVPLGEKHVTPLLDGEVTSFDITCEQPLAKGS